MVRVTIPAGVARGAVLRVTGEGLPKPRGGRGDLLVRVTYRVEVKVSRGAKQPSSSRRLGWGRVGGS
jgi:DnaJ-class molecular chaperone